MVSQSINLLFHVLQLPPPYPRWDKAQSAPVAAVQCACVPCGTFQLVLKHFSWLSGQGHTVAWEPKPRGKTTCPRSCRMWGKVNQGFWFLSIMLLLLFGRGRERLWVLNWNLFHVRPRFQAEWRGRWRWSVVTTKMTWRWKVAHLFLFCFFWLSILFRGDRKPS